MKILTNNKQESIWAHSIPVKEQLKIFVRLLHFVKPYKLEMILALVGAFLVSVINMLLPFVLQYFIDKYLIKSQNDAIKMRQKRRNRQP